MYEISHDMMLLIFFVVSFGVLSMLNDKFSHSNQIKYNQFADTRRICCIPNFLDVVSNIIFVIGGLYNYDKPIIMLCSILVAFGSTWFHINPTMNTLVFDRIPMILFLTYIVGYKLHWEITNQLIFTFIGLLTIAYWMCTYDIIPYSTFQIAPLLFFAIYGEYGMRIPVLLYVFAKICEDNDRCIYELTNNIISGHTLKHLFAGCSLFFI